MAVSGESHTQQPLSVVADPPFLWWRFLGVLLALAAVGWGFISSAFCRPAPSKSEQAIFCLLLTLILFETAEAGWYRRRNPWEATAFGYIASVLKLMLYIVVGVVGIVLIVKYVVPFLAELDAMGLLVLLTCIPVLVLLVWAFGYGSGDGR